MNSDWKLGSRLMTGDCFLCDAKQVLVVQTTCDYGICVKDIGLAYCKTCVLLFIFPTDAAPELVDGYRFNGEWSVI
jgi:hypothetical protein